MNIGAEMCDCDILQIILRYQKIKDEISNESVKELCTDLAYYLSSTELCSYSHLWNADNVQQTFKSGCSNKTNRHFHQLSILKSNKVIIPSTGKPLMAKSKFEYVKLYEADDSCLPNTWIVVRIDGKGFHRFCETHQMEKPNDSRCLKLMNRAAAAVMSNHVDIILAYGVSDEYSFIFKRNTNTYNRRRSKLMTTVVSQFASAFVFHWSKFFINQELQYPPSFDSRVVLYPTDENLRDYLSWRQVDCHINNLYNTVFWKLINDGKLTPNLAQEKLKHGHANWIATGQNPRKIEKRSHHQSLTDKLLLLGTDSGQKHEILFKEFNINYNDEPEFYKKGTVIIRQKATKNSSQGDSEAPKVSLENSKRRKIDSPEDFLIVLHSDIIKEKFWTENPHLLSKK